MNLALRFVVTTLVLLGAAPLSAKAPPRLPRTFNVGLRAGGEPQVDGDGKPITWARLAQEWLAIADLELTGKELAAKLQNKDGPLDWVMPENIVRVETNLQ